MRLFGAHSQTSRTCSHVTFIGRPPRASIGPLSPIADHIAAHSASAQAPTSTHELAMAVPDNPISCEKTGTGHVSVSKATCSTLTLALHANAACLHITCASCAQNMRTHNVSSVTNKSDQPRTWSPSHPWRCKGGCGHARVQDSGMVIELTLHEERDRRATLLRPFRLPVRPALFR